jgi:hypothetical protein
MEYGLLKFSSANIKPFGIHQSLQSTNVVGIIPVTLEVSAMYFGFPIAKPDLTSSEAA